jgi:hypothetical protein
MRSIPLYAVTVLLAAAAPADASTLYKCLDPAGKPVYSDRPCEGVPAKTIKVAALPTPVAREDDEEAEEADQYDEPDDEPVEETDAQVYARKAQERRAEDLKRKQAAAALLRSKERPPQVKRP